jgi:TonB family protein
MRQTTAIRLIATLALIASLQTTADLSSVQMGAAVRVGKGIQPPRKTVHVPPEYPPIAQAAGVQGVVIIEAEIDTDGRVRNARVVRSIPLLDKAAVDSVRQWEFTPTKLDGVPVRVMMTVTVNFLLDRSSGMGGTTDTAPLPGLVANPAGLPAVAAGCPERPKSGPQVVAVSSARPKNGLCN